MSPLKFDILPAPPMLQDFVEFFRIAEYSGEEAFSITVCLNGLPGIVFQHNQGHTPVEKIVTSSHCTGSIPTFYVYGQMTETGVMHHKAEPYKMTQVILKPHALQTLLGLNASALTNRMVELGEFAAGDLEEQMMEAGSAEAQVALLTQFLVSKLKQETRRDALVQEGLHLIRKNVALVTVEGLIQELNISERHFERRFSQAVGLSPQFYIRVQRFKEAIRLIKSGRYQRLTDIAHDLNFHDQSHLIRDIKAFAGMTPKSLSKQAEGFLHGQAGYVYT